MTPEEAKKAVEGLEQVAKIQLLKMEPGDVLVFSSDRPMSRDACENLERYAQSVFPGHLAIVLDQGLSLEVFRAGKS